MNAFTQNQNQTGQGQQQMQQPAAGQVGQKEDYGDKAFNMITKKAGHPVDRNTGEKITDAARGAFEKITGKPVNSKFSN